MIFNETELKGAFVLELNKLGDNRGFFARAFCAREFANHGLNPNLMKQRIGIRIRMA